MSDIPWFKIDDKHHDHKKTRRALRGAEGKRRDASAMGLWELAGSWCADNLTDGFVPTDELYRWDDDWQTLADRLVDAGYWEAEEIDGEDGYRFVNWDEHQPVKAEVEAKREAARERMRNIRSGSRSGSSEVRANETRSDNVRSLTPSRPVPSRPEGSKEPSSAADEPRRGKKSTGSANDSPSIEANGGKRPTTRRVRARLPGYQRPRRTTEDKAARRSTGASVTSSGTSTSCRCRSPREVRPGALKAKPTGRPATPFPTNGTEAEKDAWVRAQPLPTDGAYYGGSRR